MGRGRGGWSSIISILVPFDKQARNDKGVSCFLPITLPVAHVCSHGCTYYIYIKLLFQSDCTTTENMKRLSAQL